MVETEQMKDRGVQTTEVHCAIDDRAAIVTRLAMRVALDSWLMSSSSGACACMRKPRSIVWITHSSCAGPPAMFKKITRSALARSLGGLAVKLVPASPDIAKKSKLHEAVLSIWRRA